MREAAYTKMPAAGVTWPAFVNAHLAQNSDAVVLTVRASQLKDPDGENVREGEMAQIVIPMADWHQLVADMTRLGQGVMADIMPEPECFSGHEQCLEPPRGWRCLLPAGHEGSCPCEPEEDGALVLVVGQERHPADRVIDMGLGAAIAVVIGFLMLMIYG